MMSQSTRDWTRLYYFWLCALIMANVQTKGTTPLYIASCYNHLEPMKLLISAGADLNMATVRALRDSSLCP